MNSSSSREKTFPVGLLGVLTMMALVLGAEGALQFVAVEIPARRMELHEARRGAGENRVRAVILVERLEDDDFVAGVDDAHHRRHHGFGRAAGDGNFALGIDAHALRALRISGRWHRAVSFAPQVMAYWLMSSAMAWRAASLTSADAGKSGNPCARLTASCFWARRVISRMTDSVNRSALADSVRCAAAATRLELGVDASSPPDKLDGALNGFLPSLRDVIYPPRLDARPRFSRRLFLRGAPSADHQRAMGRTLDGKLPSCESRSARTPLSR